MTDRNVINKSNNKPWPSGNERTTYPILSDAVKDISEEKYQKIFKTLISIYSNDRNLSLSLLPNNYLVRLNKVYNNIQKIVLKDIIIPNSIPAFNSSNYNFCWQYPTNFDLNNLRNSFSLVPMFANAIDYTNVIKNYLPDNTSSSFNINSNISDQLIYNCQLNKGYFTTEEFKLEFEKSLQVYRLNKKQFYDPSFIDTKDNNPFEEPNLLFQQFDRAIQFGKFNSQMNFTIDIDTSSHIVKIINRLENIKILSLHTFTQDIPTGSLFKIPITITDLYFTNFDKNKIYVTILSQNPSLFDCFGNPDGFDISGNPFPLIITNLKNEIGDINSRLINFTPFFHESIYTKYDSVIVSQPFDFTKTKIDLPIDPDPANTTNSNGLDSIKNVSTYKNIGYIDLSNGRNEYINILELKLSSGNINGRLFYQFGDVISPNIRQDIYYNSSFQKYATIDPSENNIVFDSNNLKKYPIIGRGLPFKILLNTTYLSDKYPEYTGFTNSIPIKLGWRKIDNNDENRTNILNFSFKPSYKFVHSNIDSLILNKDLDLSRKGTDDVNYLINYRSPIKKLELENYNNKYYFKSIPFIFLKIISLNASNAIGEQLIKSNITSNSQCYTKETYNNFDLKNKDGTYIKNTDFLFAKIYLNQTPFHSTIIQHIKKEFIFYDQLLQNFQNIKIIITDPNGEILELENEHSFTLEIYQIINVLKDTLINSKQGNIVINGIRNVYN